MTFDLAANTRILGSHLTGVQRYTTELLSRFGVRASHIAPNTPLQGIKGHLWEQTMLPTQLKGRLLWSPSNTGPLAVERQVVTLHDVVPIDHPEWLNPQFAAWYRFLTPLLVRRARAIVADSHYTKARIVHHFPSVESKVSVIHIGVDQRFAPQSAEAIAAMRQQLGIASPHYLVALGSLEPRKNLHRLLEAWARVHHRLPKDLWLVVAGAHGKRLVFGDVSFENLPPRVHLTGHVPDALLPALYSGAVAAPYLSSYEGFGLPPLESMACGTPPITGNLTSVPEVVGDAGLMVDPFDVEAIGEAVVRMVSDAALRADLARRGLARAASFTWERTADETWAVLKQAAEQ